MSGTPLQESSRRTALIFWIMTALFTAQMTWWIVFQLLNSNDRLELSLGNLELERFRAFETWREHVTALDDSLRTAWAGFENHSALSVAASRLDGWDAVYFEHDGERETVAVNQDGGTPIGQLIIPTAGGTARVVFDASLVHDMCEARYPTVRYSPDANSDTMLPDAVSLAELSITEGALADIESEHYRRLRMFVGEGSFFLLLIGIGVFVIHRALRRTREFEVRQQNFLAAVTHELKIPLASVRLYVETLATRTLPEDTYKECLTRIEQDVDRLQGMIEDTLEAGVFAKRAFHLHLEESDLSSCVQRSIELYGGRADRGGVTIERSLMPGVVANFDDAQMRRAVAAVIGNAVKYTRLSESGRTVSVTLTARGKHAIITVADEGVGIDPSDQERVFERFYRAGDELTRRVSGSGLGLYLAREIVQAHNGRITLKSDGVGHGTTVTIELPLVRVESSSA